MACSLDGCVTVVGESLIAAIIGLAGILPVFIIFAVVFYWISRFQSSIKYVMEDDEVVVSKGVWWKTKSVIPYNRITNVNIYQGPISRHYGIGRLAIQTAGFSIDRSGFPVSISFCSQAVVAASPTTAVYISGVRIDRLMSESFHGFGCDHV